MGLSLASKISIAIVGVLALAVLNSIVAIVSAFRFETVQTTLVEENLASVKAAEELEIALLAQRGYVSSYILDGGNKKWLADLAEQRTNFDYWLRRARETARSPVERKILEEVAQVQQAYSQKRDEVVALYDDGNTEAARQILLNDVTALYQDAYELCEDFIAANQKLVEDATTQVRRQVEQVTVVISVVLVFTILLGCVLLWLFFYGVIVPLRRIAADVRTASGNGNQRADDTRTDELGQLGHYVKLLMTNVAETRFDLERSQTQLAHADKLAAVGKLAASVAHEIRNPLTSIKMWLYSLRRTVSQSAEVQQRFDIVSEEIVRLENIVRNFLGFSRPAKLNTELHSVTALVDKTTELVRHRLEDHRIQIVREDEPNLPPVCVDADQLRQVFLNLINNAIEAMPDGGSIHISSRCSVRAGREMVAVQVRDAGPGIPPAIQQRVFEPFFTTKPEGTGLGLCVAAAIMARHKGVLELDLSSSQGTQWTMWIPSATVTRS